MFMNEIARRICANLQSKGWTSGIIVVGRNSITFTYNQKFDFEECFEFLENLLKDDFKSLHLKETCFEVELKEKR